MLEQLFPWLCLFYGLERAWKFFCIINFMNGAKSLESNLQANLESSFKDNEVYVSIVQPIMSGDPTLQKCLEDNLRSKTAYPREFLWMLDGEDQDAILLCQHIAEKYPTEDIIIHTLPESPMGWSPKTFKLIEGFKAAKGNTLVALDDDTVIPDLGLEKSIPYLDDHFTGAVFAVPHYLSFQNIWSAMISALVNTNSMWIYVPYTYLIEPFSINGMFFAMRKSSYEEVGGFEGMEAAVCDDYAMGQRMIANGFSLKMAPMTHPIRIHARNFSEYWRVVQRWFVFTRASIMTAEFKNLSVFYSVIFIPAFIPLSLLLLLCVSFSLTNLAALTLSFLFAFLFFAIINFKYFRSATPIAMFPLLFLSQIILPVQMLASLLTPMSITWRGKKMELKSDGTLVSVGVRTGRL